MIAAATIRRLILLVLVSGLIGAGQLFAQPVQDLIISTPAITTLKKSLANRFVQLKPHLDAGTVGLTHDGVVALRDPARIDVRTLIGLDALLEEENKDRATLYREIARANGRPEWEADLRAAFGRRWIARMPAGWHHRDALGQWQRKQ
ncbi:MAG: YdbL family protein [Usitatibacteraceae bacterium]